MMTDRQSSIIKEAIKVLDDLVQERKLALGSSLECPQAVRDYLRLQLELEENEVFCAIWLDSRHRVISFERLFTGTIDSASVYPRVVAQRALRLNAAAVIVAHNHPSGDSRRSQADDRLTARLMDSLALIDVRLLDHFVVGHGEMQSYAESGLL
ncbi:RadC family protein [Stutzerimonas kunmingensis]|uniref:RadC family protein n=1 Tax=Stutzerimonas kunmingensis TaxID=1211807 RepID=UPI0028B07077|nr:DNA repair protein RadC [Stutzerimonas kunmingensis]